MEDKRQVSVDDIKPGRQTTEFWATVLAQSVPLLLIVLYAIGVIDADTLKVLGALGLLGSGYATANYSQARSAAKSAPFTNGRK